MLRADADLPVHADEYVSISTTGEVYGPGDSVYLASWSRKATSQNFTDDASGTSYILSHGDDADDLCLVEVLLQQAEDPGNCPYLLLWHVCTCINMMCIINPGMVPCLLVCCLILVL